MHAFIVHLHYLWISEVMATSLRPARLRPVFNRSGFQGAALADDKTYRPDELERGIIRFWKEHKTFERSIQVRAGKPDFIFLEGPPTANGMPHPGHVLTRTMKDVVGRYKTMRGFRVERKAGWDCHGLPVEIEVEKELGLKNKQDIERYGVAKFNQKCRESVFRYKKEWEDMCERLGQWIDYEHPYVTLQNNYIESVWWSLQQAWKKKLLEKGYRVTPHCPRCDTGLSSHEVNLGYKEVEEPSVFVKFRRADRKDEYFLAWTTTPWTLPGNVALAVGPEIEYVRVRSKSPDAPKETYILAKSCMGMLRGDHDILDHMPGKAIVGLAYEPLFPFLREKLAKSGRNPADELKVLTGIAPEDLQKAWRVVAADFVTTEDGTGIVHTAKMYGEDDFQLGERLGIPAEHTVKTDGTFHAFVKPYAGQFVKDADAQIIEDLRTKGLLYKTKNHKHDYPFCWRCGTPLLYYARDQWFIRMSQLRDRLVAHNDTVNWIPEHVKDGRFGDFISNVKDWALSRDRYWGTPLPVWTCEKCQHRECIGSIAELVQLGGPNVKRLVDAKTLDLHKPAVDEIKLTCPQCKSTMTRETSVIDTWYDSGAAHFAQWDYKGGADERVRTVDYINEGIDQTRGWFYTLLATSTFLFDRPAYKTCVVLGLILDDKGLKMSKSKKNYTDPNEIFKTLGADSMRWYLLSSSAVTADKRFFPAAIQETHARMFLTLWNTHQFLQSYAELDGWKPGAARPPAFSERPLMDRWLLTRLQSATGEAVREADEYNFHKATLAIQGFLVNDLSNWWLRRSRRRFWSEEATTDKASAYATLHEALLTVAALAAPYAPFVTEHLYQQLRLPNMPESVHLTNYPAGIPAPQPVEAVMDEIRDISEAVRRLRDQARVKTRIPLQKLTLVRGDTNVLFRELLDVVKEEANVKDVQIVATASGLEDYEAKINQQVVGREFKTDAKPILEAARNADPVKLGRELSTTGKTSLAGKELDAKFFVVKSIAAEGTLKADLPRGGTLILDARLTPELEAEGWARELVRRIQEMRKAARLDLEDQIETSIQASDAVAKPASKWTDYIQRETRSRALRFNGAARAAHVKEWDIEGEKVTIGIQKA
jgi:isoleucyl-tRNA synthetase